MNLHAKRTDDLTKQFIHTEVTLLQKEAAAARKEAEELKAQLAQLRSQAALEEEKRERERSASSPRRGIQTTKPLLTEALEQHRKSEKLAALEIEKAKAELQQMKRNFAHQLQMKERSYQTELAKIKRGIYSMCIYTMCSQARDIYNINLFE